MDRGPDAACFVQDERRDAKIVLPACADAYGPNECRRVAARKPEIVVRIGRRRSGEKNGAPDRESGRQIDSVFQTAGASCLHE